MSLIEVKLLKIVKDSGSAQCYRVLFEEMEGHFVFPVVISALDARPLLAALDDENDRRPRTHDLFCDFIRNTGYSVVRAEIVAFEHGIFLCRAVFEGTDRTVALDCRVSDALGLALRCDAGIYVASTVIHKLTALLDVEKTTGRLRTAREQSPEEHLRALERKLAKLIEEERYEDAALLRDQINELRPKN